MAAALQETDYLLNLYSLRADNLCDFAKKLGHDKTLASILGLSPARLHRLIRKRDVPFTEKMARAVESRLDRPTGWLDDGEDSAASSQYLVPVYLLEDLNDITSAAPATKVRYITELSGVYFVQLLGQAYEPKIYQGAKVLINPNETILQEGKMYALSYEVDEHHLKPVIRIYRDGGFLNIVTGEIEITNAYSIHGRCELIINKP